MGLIGFNKSYWNGDLNIRQLLFIKSIALDCYEEINHLKEKNRDELCSNFKKELELLLFDM